MSRKQKSTRKNLMLGLGALGILASAGSANANTLYFAMPINFDGGETDTVFVYGAAGVTGTITSPNGFSSSYTIGATGVASVVIPSSFDLVSNGTVTNNGFAVTTTDPAANVGASYLSRESFTTDTTYLFNSTSLGTSYYAVGAPAAFGGSDPSQLSIVGTQAGTTVTITPSTTLSGGQLAGVPFTVTLGAGQAVLFTSPTDVTGTRVTSSAPIAVFGGNQCTDLPLGSFACDHTLTALPSTDNYTTHAVIATTFGVESPSSNIVQILAATNGTVVSYQGAPIATLNAGQSFSFRSGAGGELTSTNPILIVEDLTGNSEHSSNPGDPAQSYVPGVSQWLKDYIFSTPVGSQAYANNFLDLAILATDVGSLVLNGSAVPAADCTALAGTIYDTCEIKIAAGAGEVSDADPFLLLLDGGTDFDSYFTFGGTTFSAGASPPPPPPNGVPEPASLGLLGIGLIGFGLLRRRRAQ